MTIPLPYLVTCKKGYITAVIDPLELRTIGYSGMHMRQLGMRGLQLVN